ncbi:MAG: hypothetical protein L6R40_007151 [Gallowayella cf. fulva]|nr:MAG: hypothetical protein L6R40_007151 [Xanthomendoza cf. fulva]
MEHLHLPRNLAIPGPDPVPCVCTDDYDDQPFLSYPIRQEKAYILDAAVELQYRAGVVISTPIGELEAFVQTWLFFGLLKEILRDRITASQLINHDDSMAAPQRRLNTTSLIPILQNWVDQVQSSEDSEGQKQAQYDHLAQCLQIAFCVLYAIRYPTRRDFNRQVMLSIASSGELLTAATNQAYSIRDFGLANKCPGTWSYLFHEDSVSIELMKRHGYCPSEINLIRNSFITLSTIHFLAWMDRSDPATTHERCEDSRCVLRDRNKGSDDKAPFKAKHRIDSCYCPGVTVDIAKVINILSHDGLPALRFIQDQPFEEIRLEVVEAFPYPASRFVAISHVWSDGLGNPESNSLPECQIRRILDLVKAFFDVPTSEERPDVKILSQDVLIWIDTLLVPIEPPEAKAMALAKMQQPYTDAAIVLVIDASLYKIHSLGPDPIEKSLFILTSPWMRRLWTLQEGALAARIYFQFRDVAVNLRNLYNRVMGLYNADISYQYLALDIGNVYGKLRNFFHSYISTAGPDLATAVEALEGRSVTEAADEPLLIAGLLQLDLGKILQVPDRASRMQRLWTLMPSAPKGIPMKTIFRDEPKLSQKGFRWAPHTFLGFRDERGVSLSTKFSDELPARLTPDGLEVCFTGLNITMPVVPAGLPRNPWNIFRNLTGNDISCRHADGTWFHMKIKDSAITLDPSDAETPTLHSMLRDRTKRSAIILSTPVLFNGSGQAHTGLLVYYANEKQAIPSVCSDVLITIGTKLGAAGVLLEAVWQRSQIFLEDDITAQFMSLDVHDEDQQKQDPAYSALVAVLEQRLRAAVQNLSEQRVLDALSVYQEQEHTNALAMFHGLIVSFYLGSYADLGTMLPAETRWCVD